MDMEDSESDREVPKKTAIKFNFKRPKRKTTQEDLQSDLRVDMEDSQSNLSREVAMKTDGQDGSYGQSRMHLFLHLIQIFCLLFRSTEGGFSRYSTDLMQKKMHSTVSVCSIRSVSFHGYCPVKRGVSNQAAQKEENRGADRH